MPAPFTYPVAKSIFFDKTQASPAFMSDDSEAAIIEARETAQGTAAGYVIGCGISSNASNKYLEFFDGLSSDTNPFVFSQGNVLSGFSVATSSASTCAYEVRINAITVYTLNQSGLTAFITGLNIPVIAGDKLSVYATSGTANKPVFNSFSKVG